MKIGFASVGFLRNKKSFVTSPEVKTVILVRVSWRNRLKPKNLEDDLTVSIACIYRSSAVAIQGLGFGVQPIFSDEGSGYGLDPIDSTLIPHKSFSESEELISILSQLRESWEHDFTTQFNLWFEFQNKYYSQLDSKILASLFER